MSYMPMVTQVNYEEGEGDEPSVNADMLID